MTRRVESDYIIIGAGLYGLYAARYLASRGQSVTVLECDDHGFGRGSLVNQARVHNGYHYPRSLSTARESAAALERFVSEFGFAINRSFTQVYALARKYSLTSAGQFKQCCRHAGIPCQQVEAKAYFNDTHIEAAFEVEEYSFDAKRIYDWLISELTKAEVKLVFNTRIKGVDITGAKYCLSAEEGAEFEAPTVINATYASTNQLLKRFGFEPLPLKYELCEVILANVNGPVQKVGLTVMDGPFFSLMPFGLSNKHSLTTVGHTPHQTSYNSLPQFSCQADNPRCTPSQLDNCQGCSARPKSAWPYMSQLARKYLKEDVNIKYESSLFTIKPILKAAEIDDSRPTLIKDYGSGPLFITVFSGKINGFYQLTDYLDHL